MYPVGQFGKHISPLPSKSEQPAHPFGASEQAPIELIASKTTQVWDKHKAGSKIASNISLYMKYYEGDKKLIDKYWMLVDFIFLNSVPKTKGIWKKDNPHY